MKKWITSCVIVLSIVTLSSVPVPATPVSYFGYDFSSNPVLDAEKSPTSTEDDLMCWAAAAANVLVSTGWGDIYSTSEDTIFVYFQDHWTDEGGLPGFAWEWWFNGTNAKQGVAGWSQVDVPGGTFYPGEVFADHYARTWEDNLAMSAVDQYLHAGDGVALGLYGPGGHAITVWGYEYDDISGDYLGVWVTDSDDDKTDATPENELVYYDVLYSSDQWYLQDFYGSDSWYIGEVMSLGQMPAAGPVPEPATIVLLACGLIFLAGTGRKGLRKGFLLPGHDFRCAQGLVPPPTTEPSHLSACRSEEGGS